MEHNLILKHLKCSPTNHHSSKLNGVTRSTLSTVFKLVINNLSKIAVDD